MRHRWSIDDPEATVERFVVAAGGADIGYVMRSHESWAKMPERFGRMSCVLRPAAWSAARVDALIGAMEERQGADGAKKVTRIATDRGPTWQPPAEYVVPNPSTAIAKILLGHLSLRRHSS